MHRLLVAGLVLAATLGATAPSFAATYTVSDLQARIASEMRSAPASSGAYVRDLDSGRVIYARRATQVRIPASVEKLFTTSAALLRLGPWSTLTTEAVAAPGAIVTPGGVLRGDLVLVGGGDPFLADAGAKVLARAVAAAGIRRIAGSVVGDESAFDDRRAACCKGYDGDLGGVLSALAYDRGIHRGRARLDAARIAAARFAAVLRSIGVRSTGRSRAGSAPPGARVVAALPSMPVRDLARYVNVPSNNFAAEMLLKQLGRRYRAAGTTRAGAAVVRSTLGSLGVRPRIVDGSGLSRRNRATPMQVVRLLERMSEHKGVGPSMRRSLAVAGRTGTVKSRMRGTAAAGRCRVKTGTLRLVSALAGYCRARGGRTIGFALMFNRANVWAAKAREDRIAAAIARLTSAPARPRASGGAVPRTAG